MSEADFYNKLRESMEAERSFHPNLAEWETLQQRLKVIPAASVPLYLTTKFLLAMLTTIFIALYGIFYWSAAEIDPQKVPLTDDGAVAVATETVEERGSEDKASVMPTTESEIISHYATQSQIDQKTVLSTPKAVSSTQEIAAPIEFSTNRTQILSYENTNSTTMTSANSIHFTTLTSEKQLPPLTASQLSRNVVVPLAALPTTAFPPLKMQQPEQDTFIIKQVNPTPKPAKALRWQLGLYGFTNGNLRYAFASVRPALYNESQAIGVGLRAEVVLHQKWRASLSINNARSTFGMLVYQFDESIEPGDYEPYIDDIGTTVANSFSYSNNTEIGLTITYYPLATKTIQPYFGIGVHGLRTSVYNGYSIRRNLEMGVETTFLTERISPRVRTLATANLGLQVNFTRHWYNFVEAVGMFGTSGTISFEEKRFLIGLGYAF